MRECLCCRCCLRRRCLLLCSLLLARLLPAPSAGALCFSLRFALAPLATCPPPPPRAPPRSFRRFCIAWNNRTKVECYSDEHYFPTLVSAGAACFCCCQCLLACDAWPACLSSAASGADRPPPWAAAGQRCRRPLFSPPRPRDAQLATLGRENETYCDGNGVASADWRIGGPHPRSYKCAPAGGGAGAGRGTLETSGTGAQQSAWRLQRECGWHCSPTTHQPLPTAYPINPAGPRRSPTSSSPSCGA